MSVSRTELLYRLTRITQENIQQVKQFMQLDESQLTRRPSSKQWNILECIEHLNRYGAYYIPEIKRALVDTPTSSVNTFKSSALGRYFVKSVMPKTEKLNKMKTFADKNPLGDTIDISCLKRFIDQQEMILQILQASDQKDLQKIKTGISISRWIKLRLGDTLGVLIQHNARHIQQAKNIL